MAEMTKLPISSSQLVYSRARTTDDNCYLKKSTRKIQLYPEFSLDWQVNEDGNFTSMEYVFVMVEGS